MLRVQFCLVLCIIFTPYRHIHSFLIDTLHEYFNSCIPVDINCGSIHVVYFVATLHDTPHSSLIRLTIWYRFSRGTNSVSCNTIVITGLHKVSAYSGPHYNGRILHLICDLSAKQKSQSTIWRRPKRAYNTFGNWNWCLNLELVLQPFKHANRNMAH